MRARLSSLLEKQKHTLSSGEAERPKPTWTAVGPEEFRPPSRCLAGIEARNDLNHY